MYKNCSECSNEFGVVRTRAIRPDNRNVPLCPRCYDLSEMSYLEGLVHQAREQLDTITVGGNDAHHPFYMP